MLTKSPSSISLRALKIFSAACADSEIKTTRTFPPLPRRIFLPLCVDLARQEHSSDTRSQWKKEFKNRFISQTFISSPFGIE